MTSTQTAFKQQYGWSVRALLPVTPSGAAIFFRYGISANAVSVLSLVAFLIGLWLYLMEQTNEVLRVGACLLFVLGTYLDVVDGYVARMAGTTGKGGAYLDAGIDLLRYNLFFLAVWLVASLNELATAALVLYALLLNISFARLFRSIARGDRRLQANEALGKLMPNAYREFCHKWKLLYNPLNLEDQLLFVFFIVGVLFGLEAQVILFCTAVRVIEVALAVAGKYVHHGR